MWLRNREGTEPLSARSPVRARRILSVVALVVGAALAIFCLLRAMSTGEEVWLWEAAIAGFVAVVAAADLLVLRHRR
ncbi:DUF6343 family protein [Nonomuraea sp. NPDC059023]|uniref:DUF6343 family protein n=1 Tax=unclassified Nonomuraea TaxID=2593643 RepID=UPI00368A6F01